MPFSVSRASRSDLQRPGGEGAPERVNEPGIQNWTVYLDVNRSGTFDSRDPYAVTDATGAYSIITTAAPGAYTVAQVLQPNWTMPPLPGNCELGRDSNGSQTLICVPDVQIGLNLTAIIYAHGYVNPYFPAKEIPWDQLSTTDSSGNLVFLPTGNTSTDFFGGLRDNMDYYSSSVVALKGDTGELAWHFQMVHHDIWDYDTPAQPTLFEFERDTRDSDVWATRGSRKSFRPTARKWPPRSKRVPKRSKRSYDLFLHP